MNHRKLNISRWTFAGLAVVMVIGCLVAATGNSLARYRINTEKSILFAAQIPGQVYLGKPVQSEEENANSFDPAMTNPWEMVNGHPEMTFLVANGTTETEFFEKDQQFRIRLVGSLGIWDESQTVKVSLFVPRPNDPSKEEELTATAPRILPQSNLYGTFGEGWVFSFRDEQGKEYCWDLKGGQFSTLQMRIVLDGIPVTDVSLLQLQVTSDVT